MNVLINNAGVMPLDDPSSELSDSDVERVTETNFVAPIRAMRDNPGANEHGFVHGFNMSLIENPIPTAV